MTEWNGMLISEMQVGHIENTMKSLKKRSYARYGESWNIYVDTVYFDLEAELKKREAVFK